MRLPERFRSNALLALGSPIRYRRFLEPYSAEKLGEYLDYAFEQAGAPQLMTRPLLNTLVEHSAGNLRLLNTMTAELLTMGAQNEQPQLDEKLFLDLYALTLRKTGAR